MFNSPYEAFTRETKKPADEKNDGQGEPLKKESRTSEVKASMHAHDDGSYSVETPEEGLSKHDDFESASEHMSKAVGRGDNFGMDSEKAAGSSTSKLSPRGPRDDMSGAEM